MESGNLRGLGEDLTRHVLGIIHQVIAFLAQFIQFGFGFVQFLSQTLCHVLCIFEGVLQVSRFGFETPILSLVFVTRR